MNSSTARKIDATVAAFAAQPRFSRGHVALAASVAAGVVVGVIATTQGATGLALAAIVSIPVGIAAAMSIASLSRAASALLVATAASYGVVVHHAPQITVFEIAVIVPAVWFLARGAVRIAELARREPVVWSFVVGSAALVLLGVFYCFWSPTHLSLAVQRKEFGKNVEILVLALAVFAYVDRPRRFRRAYALLALLTLVGSIRTVVNNGGHVFHTETLQTPEPLAFLVLALPFVRRLPTAFLAGAAGVLLLVTRTREAWLAALALAIGGVVAGVWRRKLGRGTVAALGACAVALVVAIALIPSTRARIDSLVSGHDSSVQTRLQMLHGAEVELGRFPIAGVGPGHFKDWLVEHPHLAPPIRIGVTQVPRDPHNMVAKFAAEMGIPGLAMFILWAASVLTAPWVAWQRSRRLPPERERRSRRDRVDLHPYLVGLLLYAPLYLLAIIVSEWGSIARVELAVAAGLFLSLLVALPRRGRADVGAEARAS